MNTNETNKSQSKTEMASANKHQSDQGATDPKNLSGLNSLNGEFGEPSAAMVHDLAGFALIALPAELRALLGDEDMVKNALEVQAQELLVIVREKGVLAYVHLPFIVKEMEPKGSNEDKGGLVLKDITAATAEEKVETETAESKPTTSKKSAKPSAKKGTKP